MAFNWQMAGAGVLAEGSRQAGILADRKSKMEEREAEEKRFNRRDKAEFTRQSTPRADKEFRNYLAMTQDGLWGCTLLYHYTRLIELLNCLERAEEILQDERICGTEIRITTNPANAEGVGVIEAPRGTLIHHYWVNAYGAMEKANLIVATGHNNIAMNRSVELVAKEYIHNGEVREGLLNRVEGAIRCYDPCLSCSTHALGQMALKIQVFGHTGEILRELRRD